MTKKNNKKKVDYIRIFNVFLSFYSFIYIFLGIFLIHKSLRLRIVLYVLTLIIEIVCAYSNLLGDKTAERYIMQYYIGGAIVGLSYGSILICFLIFFTPFILTAIIEIDDLLDYEERKKLGKFIIILAIIAIIFIIYKFID